MTFMLRRPVISLTLLALVLRLINLPWRTTEYDEIVSILFAAADLPAMVRGTAADTMPPLYYALLHLWAPTVGPLWWERLPSVFFSTATVPVVFALGRRTLGDTAAVAGALLTAISPFFIFFGQFARMYALLTLLVLLVALCLLEAATTGRKWAFWGYGMTALAALYTHNLGVINLAAIHLAAFALVPSLKQPRSFFVRLAIADVLVAVGYLPWLSYLPEQLTKVNRAFWIPVPGAAELVRTPVMFLFNLPAPAWALPVLLFWTVLLFGAGGWAVARAGIPRRLASNTGLLFIVTLSIAPVALMFVISLMRPIYVERGVLAAAAAGYLLAGWGYSLLPRKIERYVLAMGTVFLMAGSLLYYYRYEEFPRSRYQDAANTLAAALQPGDAVLHETKLTFFPMRYFQHDLLQFFVADPPGSPNDTLAPTTMATFGVAPTQPAELAASAARVWVVLYRRSFEEAGHMGGEPSVLTSLRPGMIPGQPLVVGDLVLVPFQQRAP